MKDSDQRLGDEDEKSGDDSGFLGLVVVSLKIEETDYWTLFDCLS